MDGTTLCPHCNTRFRIAGEQIEAHQGMVRCGHCMQAFDARPGFIPDQPDPQLELPILDQVMPSPERPEEQAKPEPEVVPAQDESSPAEAPQVELPVASVEPEPPAMLDFSQPLAPAGDVAPETPSLVIAPATGVMEEEEEAHAEPRKRRWPWVVGSTLLTFLLLAQAVYFFRVELAARLPGLKPALVAYCKPLDCTVPLPQDASLMSIESSELEADPVHANQITLVALLRNRATHAQAFPSLELTLNDTQDKVLARRVFRPADYLPATESETAGLRPNRELNIRLKLDTTDLRPTGYRLALFYPQ